MSTKVKFILTFIGGFVLGIIVICIVGVVMSYANSSNDGTVYFEKAGQVIPIREFKVIQVYDNGSALTMADDTEHYGTVVAFPARDGSSYYDDQKIVIPSGKCVKQIGTFKYMTRQEIEKTVPIVEIFDI